MTVGGINLNSASEWWSNLKLSCIIIIFSQMSSNFAQRHHHHCHHHEHLKRGQPGCQCFVEQGFHIWLWLSCVFQKIIQIWERRPPLFESVEGPTSSFKNQPSVPSYASSSSKSKSYLQYHQGPTVQSSSPTSAQYFPCTLSSSTIVITIISIITSIVIIIIVSSSRKTDLYTLGGCEEARWSRNRGNPCFQSWQAHQRSSWSCLDIQAHNIFFLNHHDLAIIANDFRRFPPMLRPL